MTQLAAVLDRYYRGLPQPLRQGYALPSWPRRSGELSGLVPVPMWDGGPDLFGLVTWKRTGHSPDPSGTSLGYGHRMPPLFFEFLFEFRLYRTILRLPWGTLRLPSTPTHDPYQDFHRLVARWSTLFSATGQLAVAESEDGTLVALADRRSPDAAADGEIALYPTGALSQLATELLIRPSDPDKDYEKLKALGRPLFRSMAELFSALADQSWAGYVIDPNARPLISHPSRYAWPADQKRSDPSSSEPSKEEVAAIDNHCERIRGKIAHLRSQDPGFLFEGSVYHRHRFGPQLTPEHIAAFEAREGCRLPFAYGRYLQLVGDGGVGLWRGLWPLEYSSPVWQCFRHITKVVDEGRLARPFPYREHWNPPLRPKQKAHPPSYFHQRHTQGTLVLGEDWDAERRRIIALLVLNGPEAGHIWSDHRHREFGIKPSLQTGATSFLQWMEQGIDGGIAIVDALYARLANDVAANR